MKNNTIMRILILFLWFCNLATWTFGQSSGTVDYEITRRVDGNRIRIVTRGGGGGNWTSDGGGEGGNSMVINLKQQLVFSPGIGKMSQPQPAMAMPPGANVHIMRPFEETTFIDFNNQAYLKYLRGGAHQADSTAYFLEEPFEVAAAWEESKKTKTIQGYECQRATCEYESARYTVWFTDQLGLTFSPVNGIIPPEGGFVLAIEGDDMAYEAKAVTLEKVALESFMPPTPAKKVDAEQYEAQRKVFVESLTNSGQFMIKE